jgi:cell division protein ZapA (FtsZ GTPase activity inhibitor)
MSAVKPVDVSIMGREFTVSCTDEEREGLLNAVSYLDKKMHDIRDSGKVVGLDRIAIMAALNLSHELLILKLVRLTSVIISVGLVPCRIKLMKRWQHLVKLI